MRHLAIGDIHGCFTALETLARFVPFRSEDVLVTLGDCVDRGPDSAAVLDWLIAWRDENTLIPLRGNHEIMMLEARTDRSALRRWLSYGGKETLESYSHLGDEGSLVDVPDSHWEFLERDLVPWHETETHIFVHANLYPDMPLADQPDYMLYWEDFGDPSPHESGKIMVCGHTSQRSGVPKSVGHAICIDTWVYGDGWLTCLDLERELYWQANQRGETRVRNLQFRAR
jgi:serine/threonine protein phosphatase 1